MPVTLELAGDFTIEAWVKPETAALAGTASIVAKWAPAAGGKRSYRLYLDAGIPKLDLSSNGTAAYTLSGTGAALVSDSWAHVAATRSGSAVRLFVDASEVAAGTYAGALYAGEAALVIGADGEGSRFAGVIDEVRVSSADRSETLGKVVVDYTYNARNQLVTETSGTSVKTYSYDMNGNTVAIIEAVGTAEVSREEMTYDELNRMTSHTGPKGTESFTYRGAEWHRFSQSAKGIGTSFLYDGDNVIADIAGGSTEAFYVTPFLDQNLSMTRCGTTHYYSQDGLGSVRTLSDSSGSAKNRYDYLPFGKPFAPGTSAAVLQRYTYTGREENPAGPLMYYRYRQYDPRAGRFGGRDPARYSDGPSLQVYVFNNPTRLVDPSGLKFSFTTTAPQYTTGALPEMTGTGSYILAAKNPGGTYTVAISPSFSIAASIGLGAGGKCCCRVVDVNVSVSCTPHVAQFQQAGLGGAFPPAAQAAALAHETGHCTAVQTVAAEAYNKLFKAIYNACVYDCTGKFSTGAGALAEQAKCRAITTIRKLSKAESDFAAILDKGGQTFDDAAYGNNALPWNPMWAADFVKLGKKYKPPKWKKCF